MPSRVIRGEILTSDSLSRVSRDAEALFFRLLIAADDFGRLDGRLGVLRASVWPARDDVSLEQLDAWLDELAGCDEGGGGPLLRYSVAGRQYLQLSGWEKHRSNSKRSKSSRFPGPPATARENPGDPGEPRISARLTSDVCRVTSDECRAEETAEAAEPETRLSQPTLFEPEPAPEPAAAQTPEQAADAARAEAEAALPQLEAQHRPLLNLLSKLPGSPREKELFLLDGIDQMLLEVDGDPKRLKPMVMRWYKAYLRRPIKADVGQPRREFEAAERRERWGVASAAHHARNAADPAVQARIAYLEADRAAPRAPSAIWGADICAEVGGRGR